MGTIFIHELKCTDRKTNKWQQRTSFSDTLQLLNKDLQNVFHGESFETQEKCF